MAKILRVFLYFSFDYRAKAYIIILVESITRFDLINVLKSPLKVNLFEYLAISVELGS